MAKEPPENMNSGWPFYIGVIVVLLVILAVPLIAWNLCAWPKSAGEFGDMFGVANALFSGLAFALLVFTLWVQRQEFKRTFVAIKKQNELMHLQTVEATYAKLADDLIDEVAQINDRYQEFATLDEAQTDFFERGMSLLMDALSDLEMQAGEVTDADVRESLGVAKQLDGQLMDRFLMRLNRLTSFLDAFAGDAKDKYLLRLVNELAPEVPFVARAYAVTNSSIYRRAALAIFATRPAVKSVQTTMAVSRQTVDHAINVLIDDPEELIRLILGEDLPKGLI